MIALPLWRKWCIKPGKKNRKNNPAPITAFLSVPLAFKSTLNKLTECTMSYTPSLQFSRVCVSSVMDEWANTQPNTWWMDSDPSLPSSHFHKTKQEQEYVAELQLQLTATRRSSQSDAVQLYSTAARHSLTRIKETRVLGGCVHAPLDALWAQLDGAVHEREHVVVCVLGTAHLCVHPARWCSLLLKPSGAVTPLPPHQPVSSLACIGLPSPLPLPRCLLLSLIQPLTVSWWMVPSWWGDSSCNCSVFLFLSLGSWKVLYFRNEIPLGRLRWPFSSSCTPDTSVLNSNHISIDVPRSLLV